jgi:CheY-like chemotaxis protein
MPRPDKPVNRLEKIQVMVLDGSAHAAALLREAFDQLGFSNVHVVNDSYAGIQAMKKKHMHLIVADWNLRVRKKITILDDPEAPAADKDLLPLNGAEFVERLRQSPHSPNPFVPVIMVVNDNTEENLAKARAAGVNEIISKPLQADELCRRIVSLIDDTRYFITAESYKGPCRRHESKPVPLDGIERRKRQVRLVRRKEFRST